LHSMRARALENVFVGSGLGLNDGPGVMRRR
jgi:hypothetical protein